MNIANLWIVIPWDVELFYERFFNGFWIKLLGDR